MNEELKNFLNGCGIALAISLIVIALFFVAGALTVGRYERIQEIVGTGDGQRALFETSYYVWPNAGAPEVRIDESLLSPTEYDIKDSHIFHFYTAPKQGERVEISYWKRESDGKIP